MLTVIDVFSKFGWSIYLKDKTGQTTLYAIKQIVNQSGKQPKFIWVDEGKEFYNKYMNEWLKENNIVRYSTHGEHKSAVVERFNRTLKTNMWKRFTAENTRNWMLEKLMNDYNNKYHTTIKMTPIEGSLKENEEEVYRNINKPLLIENVVKYKVGDQIKNTIPVKYILRDTSGEVIAGSFYNEELQKTKQEVFRIEKVIWRKKINGIEHGLVKWLGYNKKDNTWIPMKDIKKVP